GRGLGFGGNVTLARMLNAFRQFALERFSQVTYDMPQAMKSGNYLRAMGILIAALAACIYEVEVPEAIRKGWAYLFKIPPNKKHDESLVMRMLLDTASLCPYANNVIAAVRFKETGIPLLDLPVTAASNLKTAVTGKAFQTRAHAYFRAGIGAAQIMGVPGSGAAQSFVEPLLFPPHTGGGGKPGTIYHPPGAPTHHPPGQLRGGRPPGNLPSHGRRR